MIKVHAYVTAEIIEGVPIPKTNINKGNKAATGIDLKKSTKNSRE